MLTLGIDEAGRGAALGPLVLCGVVLSDSVTEQLSAAGVRDSKKFGSTDRGRTKRAELAQLIEAKAELVCYEVCTATDVDTAVDHHMLDDLERHRAKNIIKNSQHLSVSMIYADGRLFAPLQNKFCQLRAVDHGEDHYVSVAAASICAKHVRDTLWDILRRRYEVEFGPIEGGGYPNKKTREWVARYRQKYGRLPEGVRYSWPQGLS